jgi:hypothetical protein
MRRLSSAAQALASVLFMTFCVFAQEPATLAVRGAVFKPGPWSVEDLKRQFVDQIQAIKFTPAEDQLQQVGKGIPLLTLVQAVAPKTEKVPKHYDLTFLIILEARDSYRVFFSLAELLPQCGHAQVWLIWDVGGKPLSGKEAPFRLVVLSDRGHDRYIYGIAGVNLVDGNKLANKLAAGR